MDGLPAHTRKNPLPKVKAFYDWLKQPGSKSRVVHVAGTNGKGSVCAFLNSILTTAGYKTGLFVSPHLEDIRERFTLNQKMMEKKTFARLLSVLLQKTAAYQEEKPEEDAFRPAYFETLFFIFMLWMEEEKPDFIILETGLGGRMDATNVTEHPALTVITKIGLDHCEFLGNSIEEIAEEKAGILKKGTPAVCWRTNAEAEGVFVRKAQELSIPLCIVSKEEVTFSKFTKNSVAFFLNSAYYKDVRAVLSTAALYQAYNAALAVRGIEQLFTGAQEAVCNSQPRHNEEAVCNSQPKHNEDGTQRSALQPIQKACIEAGLEKMHWEARMEEAAEGVFLDGANNPDGVEAFLESVRADGCSGKRYLLFGAAADKATGDMAGMCISSGLFAEIAGCVYDDRRSLDGSALRGLLGADAAVFLQASEGIHTFMEKRRDEDRVYVTGSLYLAGEIRRTLKSGGIA